MIQFIVALALAALTSTASIPAAFANPAEPTPPIPPPTPTSTPSGCSGGCHENAPIIALLPGTEFTALKDINICAFEKSAPLQDSKTEGISQCWLQSSFSTDHDRVLNSGRVLVLTRVTMAPSFFVLSVDDGNHPHQVAQIGCNLSIPHYMPTIGELRQALNATFEVGKKETEPEPIK